MNSITIHNVNEVLDASEPELTQNLTKLFAKLLERSQDTTFVQNYTVAIKQRLHREVVSRNLGDPPHFSAFGKACFTAGIVKMLLAVVTSHPYTPSQSKERYICQHNALGTLSELIQTGSPTERRALVEDMKKNHVVKICLSLLNHPLCIFRQLAVTTLHRLSQARLGENLPAAEAAEIIVALCKFILEGPEFFIEGMQASTTTWQSQIVMGAQDVPAKKAAEYAPRFYAMTQETALWAAHGLLCMIPVPSRKYYLDVLKKRPEILDLLLDCAIIARRPWYPETKVDYVACEALGLFFQWPPHIIPGVSTPQDNVFRAQEWKAMSQIVNILTYREDWCERIIEMWMKGEEEDWGEVKNWLSRVVVDYHALDPPGDNAFVAIFQHAGYSRAIIVRLIATLTHAAESCGITNAEIESLLRMAYLASRKNLGPMGSIHLVIENDNIMGSTALARLLLVLAKRNALDTIQGLKKAPHGLSTSTCLNHVQQITNPDVIRRFLKISLQRVRAFADEGYSRSSVGENAIAKRVFMGTAELAAALVALDTHTQGQYSADAQGARKELVLALGNAAEMAIRDKHWQQALYFGSAAMGIAENIPDSEQLGASVIAKNKRLVEQARAMISGN